MIRLIAKPIAHAIKNPSYQTPETRLSSAARSDPASAGLVADVANGSELALRRLYRDFGGLVFSIAAKSLADRREAEEVTQDVFVKAWRLAASYDPSRCTVAGWLGLMARSACLDRLRKRRCRPEFEYPEVLAAEDGDSAREARAAPDRAAIAEELSQLAEEQRTPLELAFFYGYTHREIAEKLGMTLGSAKHLLNKSLAALKSRYHRS